MLLLALSSALTDVCAITGACRQVMTEFGNFDVYCLKPDGKVSRTTLRDLIPFAFSQADIKSGAGKAE